MLECNNSMNLDRLVKTSRGGFKKGFTLAEVLITLGIIGVVAAMTIPNLITGYQKTQAVQRLKKAYSVMQQAIKLSEEDNGDVGSWDTTLKGKEFFHMYLFNYLKVMNEYSSTELKKLAPRKNLNGTEYVGKVYNNANAYHFTLLDGSMITTHLNSTSEGGLWVGIDVNGLAKPNQLGRDTFLYFFSTEYGLRPLGDRGTPSNWSYGTYTRKKVGPKGSHAHSCTKSKQGYWCAALIMQDGWTMSSDYPFTGK